MNDEQKAAVVTCNEILKSVGVPTYSKLEDELAKAYLVVLDAVDLGKRLVNQVQVLERKVEKYEIKL